MNGRKAFFVTESKEVIDLRDKPEGKIDTIIWVISLVKNFYLQNNASRLRGFRRRLRQSFGSVAVIAH